MAIQIIGNGGVVADVDGTTYRALKITQRPTEYGLRGSYRLALSTSTINAILTNGSIFQFYWPSYVALALVWGIALDYSGSCGTAQLQLFKLLFERNVTAFGTGGTQIAVSGTTGQSQQLRTSMRGSLVTQARIATSAALGNGTWTEDSNPLGSLTFNVDASGVNKNVVSQLKLFGNLEKRTTSPLVLVANEAVNLSLTTGAAAPSFVVGVSIAWSEVGVY